MPFLYQKAFTHGGVFHSDDVFGAAFLKLLNPEIKIERGFKVPEEFDGIVFDIGLGEYDHHQPDNECRENGIPYAAFGKLWITFAPELYSDYVVNAVEKELVAPLDAADNGVSDNLLSVSIGALNPTWDSEEDSDTNFFFAVSIAEKILERMIKRAQSEEKANQIVEEAINNSTDGIVVLPYFCPWKKIVEEKPEVKFVIYPSLRGGYNIQTATDKENPFRGRILFPEEWLGNPVRELGMTFCHPGNFLACTETLQQAIKVAEIAIKRAETVRQQ